MKTTLEAVMFLYMTGRSRISLGEIKGPTTMEPGTRFQKEIYRASFITEEAKAEDVSSYWSPPKGSVYSVASHVRYHTTLRLGLAQSPQPRGSLYGSVAEG